MNSEISVTGEIFIPLGQSPFVYEDDSMQTCVNRLLEKSSEDSRHLYYDRLLVIDMANSVVGSIGFVDILKKLFPSLLAPHESTVFSGKIQTYSDLSVLLEGSSGNECRRQTAITAGECMVAPLPSISTDTHLLHVLEIMVSTGNTILAVTENRVLAGVVRMSDLFKALCDYCIVTNSEKLQSVTVL